MNQNIMNLTEEILNLKKNECYISIVSKDTCNKCPLGINLWTDKPTTLCDVLKKVINTEEIEFRQDVIINNS